MAKKISIKELLQALLDENTPLHPRYLYPLSDLEGRGLSQLNAAWQKISLHRRQTLMEDLDELNQADDVLSFESVARIALHDIDPIVRRFAVHILREYELRDLIPTFIKMLESDDDAEVRGATAAALSTFVYLGELEELPPATHHHIEDVLLHVTKGSDAPSVRRKALEALGFSSREEVSPLLEAAYNSNEPEWLISALLAMGRSANKHWHPAVLAMLNNQRPAVRAEAASAAGELEIADAVPQLLNMLDDGDIDVRMAAIWALSQIGGEGVQEALEALYESTEDDDEADLIDDALDNLEFTDGLKEFEMFDFDDEEEEDDELLLDEEWEEDEKDETEDNED